MANFDPLHTSEIPPRGAVIKVVAHDVIIKKKTCTPKVLSPRRGASTLGVISELPNANCDNPDDVKNQDCAILQNQPQNSTSSEEPDRRVVSGHVKSFGHQADKSEIKIQDRVVLHPGDTASSVIFARDAEYRIVSDTSFLVSISEHIPMKLAAILGGRGLYIYDAVLSARQHFREQNVDHVYKILVVCNDEFPMMAVQLLSHFLKDASKANYQLALASLQDEGIMWYKKNMPDVTLIQWNRDAYDQVLIERTANACKGEVDLVIGCLKLGSPLQRSMRCLKQGGVVLVTENVNDNVWKTLEKMAQQQNKQIKMANRGGPEDLKRLMELVESDIVQPAFFQDVPQNLPTLRTQSGENSIMMRRKARSLSSKTGDFSTLPK